MSPVLSAVAMNSCVETKPRVGVAPAQQRLHRVHSAGFERHDRLVPELEFVARQRVPQVGIGLQPGPRLGAHVGAVALGARRSGGLGAIHRRVGVAQQIVGRGRRIAVARDADAERHEHLVPLHAEALRERAVQTVGHFRGAVGLAQAAEHDDELVAAHAAQRGAGHQLSRAASARDARHRVGAAQAAVEPPRGLDQQFVAGVVAEAVVDHLEAIEIQEHHDHLEVGMPLRMLEQAAQAIHQQHAVGEPGQGVGHLAFGDVGERPGHAGGVPGGVAHRHRPGQHPAVGVGAALDAVLVLEVGGRSDQVLVQRRLERAEIVGVHAVVPRVERREQRLLVVAEHRPPARREVALVGVEPPVPDAVVGAAHRQRVALLAFLERPLGPLPCELRADAGERRPESRSVW